MSSSTRLHKTYFFTELEAQTHCKYSQIKILKSSTERATILQCLSTPEASSSLVDNINNHLDDNTITSVMALNNSSEANQNNSNNNISNTTRMIVVRVVIKVEEEEDPRQYEILERERNAALVVSSLKHDHIVEILGFYEGDCYVYTLMPFYELGDLQQLSTSYDLSENTIAVLTYQLSKALRVLHADQNSKVVHRDIELDNIFVEMYDEKTGNIKVRLADFELCEVVDASRITCTNIGRMRNNPPTNEVGSSLDIWCLGVIIYRLLSGDRITDFHRDFKTQSEIDQIVLQGVRKKLACSDLRWAIIACLQIDKEKRINSRILMEYLLRMILVEERFDESANTNLLALKLIYKKINFWEGKKLLSESLHSMSQEEIELIPLFNTFSDLTIEKVNSIEDISDSFLIPFMKSVFYSNLNMPQNSVMYTTSLLTKFPFFINLYDGRGYFYRNMKEYSKSIKDHSKTIELDINNAKYYNSRGMTYREMQAYSKSIEDHSKAIELDINNANYYNSRGITFGEMKEYSKSIEDHSKAIELDFNSALYYRNRGIAYREMNEYSKSIEDHSKAIELDPNNAEYYDDRGITYYYLNEYLNSIKDHSKAIELDLNCALYYRNRGIVYREMNEYSKSIKDHSKAIELDPNNAEYYDDRGITYYYLNEYLNSIKDHSKAIELDINNAKYYNSRGITFREMKEYSKSIDDHFKSIELDSNNAKYFRNRGITFGKMKEYSKSIEDYTKAIELEPSNASSFYFRAILYRNLKEYEQALSDHSKSIELDATDYLILYSFAMQDYQQVILLDPSFYKK